MKKTATALAVGGALFLSASISQLASAATFNVADTNTTNRPTATAKKASATTNNKKVVARTAAVVTKTVVVNPGDYLTKIAEANNTSVQRLYDANTFIDNPDLIYPGQELKIPDEKEDIAHRDMPAASAVAQQVQAEAQASAAPAAAPAPARSYSYTPSSAPAVAGGSVWDQLAACESGGNWAINTGNGFYGGLQFTLSSWQGVGGSGYPNQASREEQIMRGQMLQARGGWGNWPACSAKLGLY
jgi:LysM repeat protein